MNPGSCQKYLEDPEANAAHLAECESCRTLAENLSAEWRTGASPVPDPPLAAWEGASYRAWPLVIAALVVVGLVTLLVFVITGTSPFSLASNVPAPGVIVSTLQHFGAAAPGVVAVLFIVVNVLFIALLRRAPRGIDV